MAYPSRRVPQARRLLAGVLSLLCAVEAGLLPAAAAVNAAPEARAPGAGPAGFDVLREAASGAGWAPGSALAGGSLPAPASAPAPRPADAKALPALLTPGVTAGVLRSSGRSLISGRWPRGARRSRPGSRRT